jgi:hypothetical protein
MTFIIAEGLQIAHFIWIAARLISIGIGVLLSSFVLLLSVIIKQMWINISEQWRQYFLYSKSALRNVYFHKIQQENLQRLSISQKKQLYYRYQFICKRLSDRDQKKQQRQLIKLIQQQLKQIRPQLSTIEFKNYQSQLKLAIKTKQMQDLLKLQQQLSMMIK